MKHFLKGFCLDNLGVFLIVLEGSFESDFRKGVSKVILELVVESILGLF